MSQQINLLNPALIKQKDLLNPNNIAITLGLLTLLMLVYYGVSQKQLSALTVQRSQVASELSARQAELKQATILHTPRALNKALLDQIALLEQKEEMQQQVLQTINLSSTTPDKGYAALMRAFAKQSLNGLWLTSFSIDSYTDKLNISGRSLQADFVPEYIARLGNEPALQGKSFSALTMSLPKPDTSATNKPSAPPSAQTINPTDKASQPPIETPYIEFTLQSTDEKLTPNSASTSVKNGSKS
ncbi:hypothetical protein GALL_169370 [mine drainage metagenome]|uniref:Fimbrial assembly protein (PilN) n=1 Tax=mine drainage metagenome TaxID=410659 RepID=A0A1J5S9T4_9ZZZZ